MRIISGLIPGVSYLARAAAELSKESTKRLKWFDYYRAHGHNARLTCRHFDISPQTFYRWKRRYNARHLESWELGEPLPPAKTITAAQLYYGAGGSSAPCQGG